MIRTKGEAGTGNVVEAVRHIRTLNKHIKELVNLDEDEVFVLRRRSVLPLSLWRRPVVSGVCRS